MHRRSDQCDVLLGDGASGKLGDGSTGVNNRASTSSIVSHFSSSEPVKAHGSLTTWALNTTLPAGLSFGTSNGTIWGTPTLLQTTAKAYTIWANNSGGSSLVTVTITINDVAPGSFEYEPENNTLTNNTGVHLAPQFINRPRNGSTWSVTNLQTAQGTSSLGRIWTSSLVIPSISQQMMEPRVLNCGRTIRPTIPRGKWLISTTGLRWVAFA